MLEDRRGIQWPLPEGEDVAPQQRAAPVRGRPVLPRRRPGAVHLRGAARRCPSRPTRATRSCCSPGAAARASGTRRRAPRKSAVLRKLVPDAAVRRDQPGRRARAAASRRTSGSSSSRGAARCARAPSSTLRRAARAGLHPDALRDDEPADARRRSTRTRASRRTSTAPCASAATATRRPVGGASATSRSGSVRSPVHSAGICSLSASGIFGRPVSTKFGP